MYFAIYYWAQGLTRIKNMTKFSILMFTGLQFLYHSKTYCWHHRKFSVKEIWNGLIIINGQRTRSILFIRQKNIHRHDWGPIEDPLKRPSITYCRGVRGVSEGPLFVTRVCNPGTTWKSRNSGIFFKISRDPGNSRDLIKINFIYHLDRDTRGHNPYTCKIPDSQQI